MQLATISNVVVTKRSIKKITAGLSVYVISGILSRFSMYRIEYRNKSEISILPKLFSGTQSQRFINPNFAFLVMGQTYFCFQLTVELMRLLQYSLFIRFSSSGTQEPFIRTKLQSFVCYKSPTSEQSFRVLYVTRVLLQR